MRYDFNHVPDRRPTDSVKWNKYDADVLPLWVADMDFPVAEPIQRALRERIEHGIFGYPDGSSKHKMIEELRDLIIERLQKLYCWQVLPDELLFMPGVIKGLNLTAQTLASEGGNVLVQTPVYPPFLQVAKNVEMERHDAMLERRDDGHYEIDWDAFEAGMTEQTRLFVLCNPHNPVGRVFRKDELEHMAELCLKRGVVICSDEIHCDLLFKGKRHIPIASLDKEIALNTSLIRHHTEPGIAAKI
jgi:cysteine-S-conjugate beta-lyase